MKNFRNVKIVSLILSLVLLVGAAIGISVSAEDTASAPSLDIISKNLSYGGTISIAFAVEAQNVGENQVSLLVYNAEPQSESEAPAYTVTDSLKQTVYGTECLVFFTNGIAAKDMPDQIYVRAAVTVDGVTTYSDLERYSVAEYAYDVQYRSELGADFVELGEYLIGIGDKIQTVLPHDKDNKPSDFLYAAVEEGTLDGKYNSGLYKAGDTVTLKYAGTGAFIGWNVKYVDANGTVTTALVEDNTTVTIDKHLVAAPASATATFEDGNAAAPNLALGNASAYNVVADPRNAAEKVLQVVTWDSTTQGETVTGDNGNLWVNNLGEMASDELYATFEGDFYIQNNASHSGWGLQFNFINKNSGSWMYAIWLSGGNNGTTMQMSQYGGSAFIAHNSVFASNWINLRMDYRVNGAESTITVYVNGQCLVKDMVACQSDATEKNTAPISKVEVRFREANYNFYTDNLSLTTSANAPEAPEYVRDGFNAASVPSYVTIPTDSTTVEIANNPTDAADKVLKFTQHATANSPRPVIAQSGAANATSPYFTFSSDVYIYGKRQGGTMNELFFSGNSGDAFRLKVVHSSSTDQILLKKWTADATTDFATPVVLPGETWFNLRVDYYVDGTNSYMNVYIDGELVASEQNYYYNSSTIANSSYVKQVSWQVNAGNNNGYAWYFDDLAFVNNVGGFIK